MTMSNVLNLFIGTWRLVYSVEIDKSGTAHYPFGEDAIGYIIYDDNAQMAVQISRFHRQNFNSDNFLTASESDLITLPKNYLAYFGKFVLDEKNSIVSHIIEGHLFPNYVEKNLERKYRFYDNKLSLKPWDGTNREIVWEKVSSN